MKTKIIILSSFLIFYTTLLFGQGMIIQPNSYVTVAGGGKLIVSDAKNGFLTIKSTASGTGSLVVDANAGSSVSVAANSNVELYLTGSTSGTEINLWHLVSSPISNGVSGTFLDDYLLSYDETTNSFSYIVPTTIALTPMQGYEAWAWVSGAKTDVFKGSLNNGNQSFKLTRSWITSGNPLYFPGDNGWNLLGNPYPCAIDFDAESGWTFGSAQTTVYIWNTGGKYKGNFASHVRGGVSAKGGSRYIPAEQGFFLHCTETTTVNMDNNVRVHSTQGYYKSATTEPTTNILRLEASGNGYNHETVILFNPDATSSYDNYDALFYNGSAASPRIYSVVNNDVLSINALPQITNNLTVSVGFKVGMPGTYTIRASELNTFGGNVLITLYDLKTSISRNLKVNPEYTFTADTLDNANRFLVIFGLAPFGTNDIQASETVQIYSFGDAVFIKTNSTANTKGQVFIFDPIGKEQFQGNLSGTEITKISPDLSTGYYVVKVVTSESAYSKKVFISR